MVQGKTVFLPSAALQLLYPHSISVKQTARAIKTEASYSRKTPLFLFRFLFSASLNHNNC